MRRPRSAIVFVVSLAFALLAASIVAHPSAAANVGYTLFGSRTAGWGPTNTTLTSPGPNLTASKGDNVILTLNSTDGRTHSWYIDYNGNGRFDAATEPGTDFPNATTGKAVTWNFTANRNGTFQYQSRFAPDSAMLGNITIGPARTTLPPILGGDNTVLIVVGVVIIIIAVLAVASMFYRRKKTPPPPQS